ncbi:MAG TPA: 4-hydroxy-tetrahydrodipicolinate synthase [Trueperaceae bacterium]|nr:4-hydroxy-tetrahydrodipicolinate synthase [Trueperaceae bacterium]
MLAPRGSIVPLPTPFSGERARIDETSLAALIEFQISSGSHGLSCTGTTGEPSSLSTAERKHVVEFVKEKVAGRVPFVPGTGSNNLDETLELTRHAVDIGVDGVMIIAPYYVRPNQRGLFDYFRTIAEAVARQDDSVPVILYNIPGRAAVNIEPATIGRLRRECPNIVGVKHATKSLDDVSYTLVEAGRDFAVYCGAETMTYPMLALGGSGHISATGVVAPAEIARLYDLAAAGRWDEARDLHYQMLELNDVLFIEVNPVPLKTALALMGLCEARWRLPLGPMLPHNEEKLKATVARYGLIERAEASPGKGS